MHLYSKQYILLIILCCVGDFHFLWECQKVILQSFWGGPRIAGSISNLRQLVERFGVDQKGKIFNVGDEFVVHVFHSHLAASICDQLKIESLDSSIDSENTKEWLQSTAESIVRCTIMPTETADPAYAFHRSFMRAAFFYTDVRNAIRFEDGPQIIRLWKHWLLYFLGTDKRNYTTEAVNMLRNIKCDFPAHIAYIAVHNRGVNMSGVEGRAKPLDQLNEHYNL